MLLIYTRCHITNLLYKFAPVAEIIVREQNRQLWNVAELKAARSNARDLEHMM